MTVQKARLILGGYADNFTDEEILEIISILDIFVKGAIRSIESERLQKFSSNENSVTTEY
jgi:hypothetical protein